MSSVSDRLARRSVLRGLLGGAAITCALPLLDCRLNANGTALAAGGPLPVRFGKWSWGCGVTPDRWVPQRTGANFDFPPELKFLEPFQRQINVLSGFDVKVDGKPNIAHQTGNIGCLTGSVPVNQNKVELPTLDVLIADAIGTGTRFRSLELAATGNPRDSLSYRSSAELNPGEGSAVGFYARIFGPEFQDPNVAGFTPDPKVMLRRSVLSGIAGERAELLAELGASDKARLDQFFTSVRQLEQQLELQLQKPPPALACKRPTKAVEKPPGYEIETVIENHRLMSGLLALALACDQTRVFNVLFSNSASGLRKSGETTSHHQLTHEELTDKELGYQPQSAWFAERSMEALATFLGSLAAIREGDGSLLDNCLVFANTDTNFAKNHSITALPALTAGKAGGRMRTGMHIASNGEPITRVGLTLQQVMGVPVDKWGEGSMQTNQPLGQLVV